MLSIFQTDIDPYNEQIGAIIGGIIGALLLVLAIVWLIKRSRRG
jgi:flagellar biogenesis protein FliO